MIMKTYWLIYKSGKARETKPFRNFESAEKWAMTRGYQILGICEKYKYNQEVAKRIQSLIKKGE